MEAVNSVNDEGARLSDFTSPAQMMKESGTGFMELPDDMLEGITGGFEQSIHDGMDQFLARLESALKSGI